MRITGGTLRGRRLTTGPGKAIRPTSSRVREAIFNMVQDRIGGARVLDLFAGAGVLGMEALSRGAASVLFVDSSTSARKTIEANLKQLGLEKCGRVFCCDAEKAVGVLSQNGESFDVILVDPPYGKGLAQGSLNAIGGQAVLARDGVIVVEHGKRERVGDQHGVLKLKTSRRYGDTLVSVFVTLPGGGSR